MPGVCRPRAGHGIRGYAGYVSLYKNT
jgi:hypothetical protein